MLSAVVKKFAGKKTFEIPLFSDYKCKSESIKIGVMQKKYLGMYVVRYLAILFMYTQDSYLLLFKDIPTFISSWQMAICI